MSYTNFRMDTDRHAKMKDIAIKEKKDIIEVYREAVDSHVAFKAKEILRKDTDLEEFINKRLDKLEHRVTSMLARTGMDTSINVMGLTLLLSKLMKVDRDETYQMLRKEASQYFSKPYREQKKEE